MRSLYLVNDVGSTFFLDYRCNTLIDSLDGLGFEYDVEHQKYDNTYLVTNKTLPLSEINLNLIFLEGYVGFAKWLEFVRKSKSLRLYYVSNNTKYCYVDIKSCTKGQLEAGTIKSSLVLEKLSLWIVKKSTEIEVDENTNKKVYPYPYPFIYSTTFNGRKSVTNSGMFKAPMRILIQGAVDNPTLSIEKEGVVVSKLRLILSRSDTTLEIESDPTDQKIEETINGVTTNIYDKQDFTCDNFLFLPVGTYDLHFEPGVSKKTKCSISFLEGYIAN
ncbi:MAG: hypothetical protein LKG11_00205 [Bacilli bacterium]|jgi:hypothetical protein|nr:hypothetical protein [Bacilli bacterium]